MQSNWSKYLEFYLNEHKDPTNRLLHFLGQITTLAFLYWIITNNAWWWLLLLPFVVYPFAWLGHWIFEGNRPASLSSIRNFLMIPLFPFTKSMWMAKGADWVMFFKIIKDGLYQEWKTRE